MQTLTLLLCVFIALPSLAGQEVQFETFRIKIGGVALEVEVAKTFAQHERGLMFRRELGANRGMLFIFNDEKPRQFWMKNTFIPLSIGFFDGQKKLVEILDMEPMRSEMQKTVPTYQGVRPAKYAIEVNQGWFKQNKISIGAQMELPTDK